MRGVPLFQAKDFPLVLSPPVGDSDLTDIRLLRAVPHKAWDQVLLVASSLGGQKGSL